MEKTNFVNRHALDFGDQLGIEQSRRETLAHHLDTMIKDAKTGAIRLVSLADIIDYIEDFCESRNEFLWSYTNHMQWLYRSGRMLLQVS